MTWFKSSLSTLLTLSTLLRFSQLFLHIAKKMKFSIMNFSSKCDQIRRKLRIWSHLLKKSLMENFIFCAGTVVEKVKLELALTIFSTVLTNSEEGLALLNTKKILACLFYNKLIWNLLAFYFLGFW